MLSLLYEPDERLRQISEPVTDIDSHVCDLLDDMLECMRKEGGIGLAAPQVNVHKRLIVMDTSENASRPLKLINACITWRSTELTSYKEGCLSVRNYASFVQRPKEVRVLFYDTQKQRQEQLFTGVDAVCIQHEIDHLNGILFIDYLSNLKKMFFRKKQKNL
jgi:peptide deformylase